MDSKRFLNVNDVATIMDISVPTAYKIIKRLNDDLLAQGYITIAGRISRAYFEAKVYGMEIA
ncbi:MAG: LysR family transcriptional regulator [Candidatus Pacebacteria bacterium]|nr:LysR family transcriptional regulator [Candidatus Paceibacterota bacterium]